MRKYWLLLAALLLLQPIAAQALDPAVAPTQTPQPSTQPFEEDEISLRVRALQERLFTLGYFNIQRTGVFGGLTKSAVEAFQKQHNIQNESPYSVTTMVSVYQNDAVPNLTDVPEPLALNGADRYPALAWDVANHAFIAGTKITVLDLLTSNKFDMVRTGGQNHAEMLCMTEEDVTACLSLKTGSWQKRPVLIQHSGVYYIASMEFPAREEFNATDVFSLYFPGSASDVSGLPDDEHNRIIAAYSQQEQDADQMPATEAPSTQTPE